MAGFKRETLGVPKKNPKFLCRGATSCCPPPGLCAPRRCASAVVGSPGCWAPPMRCRSNPCLLSRGQTFLWGSPKKSRMSPHARGIQVSTFGDKFLWFVFRMKPKGASSCIGGRMDAPKTTDVQVGWGRFGRVPLSLSLVPSKVSAADARGTLPEG